MGLGTLRAYIRQLACDDLRHAQTSYHKRDLSQTMQLSPHGDLSQAKLQHLGRTRKDDIRIYLPRWPTQAAIRLYSV